MSWRESVNLEEWLPPVRKDGAQKPAYRSRGPIIAGSNIAGSAKFSKNVSNIRELSN